MRGSEYFLTSNLLPLLVLLTTRMGVASARIMMWRQNTNFATPTNWDSGHVPCANERVVFPASSPIVYIQNSMVAAEIVLPRDGQLIFSDGASISLPIPASSDQSCPQRDVHYIGGDERNVSWFDSNNWCEVSHIDSGRCLAAQPARLDLERVPCSSDAVLFPVDSSFLVQISHSVDIFVGTLKISHQDYTTQTLRNYLKTEIGRKLFLRSTSPGSTPTTISVAGKTCEDEEMGCPCANSNDPVLKEKICEVEKERCKPLTCQDPLTPASHCCSLCGAILLVEYGSLTRVRPLENLAKKILKQKAPDTGVSIIVSKLSDGEHIQIVVLDDGSDKGMEVAEEIKKKIEEDMSGMYKYDVRGVTLQRSGYSSPSSHAHTGEEEGGKVKTFNIVMICFGLIVLLVVLALAIYCTSNNRRPIKELLPSVPEFVQRTLDSRKKRAEELELGRTVTFNNNVIFESGAGFDNPNFGQGAAPPEVLDPAGLQPHRYIPAAAGGGEEMQPDFLFNNGSFTNPLYGNQPVEAQVHAAVLHKTPIDDDVTEGISSAEFPKKRPTTKEEGTSGAKTFLDRLRPHRHKKIEEEDDDSSSDDVTSKRKKERMNKESEARSSPAGESIEKDDIDLEKSKTVKEKKHRKKGSKSPKSAEVDIDGKQGSQPDVPIPSDVPPVPQKGRKLKLPTGDKTGMHEKLVDSSSAEDEEKEMDLGEYGKLPEEEKREEKKEKREKKKKASDIDESRTGFGNPLYALEEAARRKQASEEAQRRREESASESQVEAPRLINLEEAPGESNA